MLTAHISIGSNLGDRAALIERAVARISELPGGATLRCSAPFDSEPWGYDSPNRFLNMAVAFETPLPPDELMQRLLEIQISIDSSSHRDAAGGYADRAIDIDLIALGSLVADTGRLVLPHPRMHLRRFVLQPMAELDPHWRHPLTGLSVAEMLSALDRDAEGRE